MYLRERIINKRLKRKSYEKIRLDLLRENIKISKNSIAKICCKFFQKNMLVDHKRSGRKLLFSKPMLDHLDNLISSNREISLIEIINKIYERFSIRPGVSTIYRSALKIKWKKKGTR